VHKNTWTYDEVIFKRSGQPRGRIANKEKDREETKKKVEEEEVEKSPHTSTLIHSGLVEEVGEVRDDKKRMDKEKFLKNKNDAVKKKLKINADKDKDKFKVEKTFVVE